MRLVYPLLWSRLDRKADRAQAVATAAALARRGVEVTLLLPRGAEDPALFPVALRDWFEVEGDFRLVQRPSGWAGTPLHRSLMWLRQVFRDPLLAEADLLYSRIPAMLGIGGRCSLPFAFDHYRPWPDRLPALKPLFRRTAARPNCLGFILHSEHAADSWRRAGIPTDRLLVAHNGAPSAVAPVAKDAARRALGLPAERGIALYAGRLNARKGLDRLLAVADLRPNVLFVLVGSEGEGPIEREAAARANVRVAPWADATTLALWQGAADVLLIPPSLAPLERFGDCVLPLKTYAYLAAGRSILAPAAPDTAELLRDGDTALLVPPDRPDLAAFGLDRLLGDTALARRLGDNGRALAAGLTWDARAAKIHAFLAERLKAR
jgi:glycosyltransferase involved in cell wall biosynthesis